MKAFSHGMEAFFHDLWRAPGVAIGLAAVLMVALLDCARRLPSDSASASTPVEALRRRLRALFPPLRAPSPPAFLDNAAGSLVPARVVAAVSEVLTQRGVVNSLPGYSWGRANAELAAAAHHWTGLFVNAPGGGSDIALGPSSTALAFRMSAALSRALRPGDAVVVSELEHECNASPWRELERGGVQLRVWKAAWPAGALELPALRALLADGRVKLVALTAASNAFGLKTDVRGAAQAAHEGGAKIFIDAVHAAAHELPDVARDDLDFLVFSPYKCCAPHLGALYVRSNLIGSIDAPQLCFKDRSSLNKMEYGTPAFEALAGWLAAADYFCKDVAGRAEVSRDALEAAFRAIEALEAPLKKALVEGLVAIPGVTVYGSPALEARVGTVAFRVDGLAPADVALKLGANGVCVGNGHFYAILPTEAQGVKEAGVVRASVAHYNTVEEIERLLQGVRALSMDVKA
jgi:cysteine desulfurase family protein (TIGR01976 family)